MCACGCWQIFKEIGGEEWSNMGAVRRCMGDVNEDKPSDILDAEMAGQRGDSKVDTNTRYLPYVPELRADSAAGLPRHPRGSDHEAVSIVSIVLHAAPMHGDCQAGAKPPCLAPAAPHACPLPQPHVTASQFQCDDSTRRAGGRGVHTADDPHQRGAVQGQAVVHRGAAPHSLQFFSRPLPPAVSANAALRCHGDCCGLARFECLHIGKSEYNNTEERQGSCLQSPCRCVLSYSSLLIR